MTTAELTGYADAQAVIDALDLAGPAVQPEDLGTAASAATTDFATANQGSLADSAIQPDDLAVPTGVGQADGLMTHEDKAKLDGLTLATLQATALSF